MKKNYFFSRLILAGVFTLTTATAFVGCKDYDDDISNLQTLITANTEAIKALEKLMGEGKYVTGVSKGADGSLTFTMSNGGASITIPSVDGKDGSVITINEEGYWVIDGKATSVKAKGEKGDKGDKGEQGETGPQGPQGETGAKGKDGYSPKIVGGYWHVYDDEAGKYVPTDVVAQDVLTYVTDHDTYYTLNVAAKNADGSVVTNADGSAKFESILLPKSGVLLSIAPATVQSMNDAMAEGAMDGMEGAESMTNGLQQYKIFYGILNKEVDWKGAKANSGVYKDSNTGKMGAGMYATMDRDVQLLLNPTDVDATTYDFAFASTDNTPLWGLSFKTPQPYVGKMTSPVLPDLMTRATSSANGIWTLPRNVEYVADLSGNQNRANYIQQFKKNDKDYYLLALTAKTNIQDNNAQAFFKETKSQYIYAFIPKNVDAVKINDETSKFDYSKTTEHFEIGKEYRPSFDNLELTWEEWEDGLIPFYTNADSALFYDYYVTPNMKLETAQTLATYGITISKDGYSFSATKEAALNNTVNFVFHYILLNGNTGEIPFAINFGKNAASNVQFELPAINEAFNAVDLFNKDYNDNSLLYPAAKNKVYGLSKTISLDGFFAQLGEGGKADWIDALARALARPTDDNEVVSSDLLVFSSDYVELSGGDPINNADDLNEYLYENFIRLDYVDAAGKSVIFNHGKLNEDAFYQYEDKDGNLKVDLSKLNNIAALKVTFLAIPDNGPVLPPYYTSDGEKANLIKIEDGDQEVALPLYNEFNLSIKTTKAQYVVSTLNVRFELKMPDNCLIKREAVKAHTAKWYKSEEAKEYNDVLKVYGEMNPTSGVVYADLRDAFGGAFTYYSNAYHESTPQAAWYKMEVAEFPSATGSQFIGETTTDTPVALSKIKSTNVYNNWNTFAPASAVMALYRQPGKNLEDRKSFKITNITYDHFGVYHQDTAITKKWNIDNGLELRDFSVVFGSKIEDAEEITTTSKDMIEAKAVLNNDGSVKEYTVTLKNSDFKLKDAFGAPFFLFDTDNAKRGALAGTDFIPARQGIWDLRDTQYYPTSINRGYYGLYPIVLDGDNTPVGSAVVTIEEVYPKNEVDAAKLGQGVGTEDRSKLVHMTGLKLTFKPNVGNNRPFDVVFNIADVFAVKAGLGIRQDNNSQSDLWNIYRRLEDADKGALTPLVASNELRFQVKTVNNPE